MANHIISWQDIRKKSPCKEAYVWFLERYGKDSVDVGRLVSDLRQLNSGWLEWLYREFPEIKYANNPRIKIVGLNNVFPSCHGFLVSVDDNSKIAVCELEGLNGFQLKHIPLYNILFLDGACEHVGKILSLYSFSHNHVSGKIGFTELEDKYKMNFCPVCGKEIPNLLTKGSPDDL